MFISTRIGIVSAIALPPRCRRVLACRQLRPVPLGLLGVDGEHVPVEGAAGGEGHLRHLLDLVVAEPPHAPVGDVLERGALVLAHGAAQREHLLLRRPPRGDRLAVAVGVGERERGREADPAGIDRLVQQPHHPVDLLGGRLVADGVRSHHVAAQRAVADVEHRVHRDVAVESVEIVAESRPVPGHAVLEGRQRHALDPRHHAPEVVGVLLGERREGEAAVAVGDRGDAVHGGRRRLRVPEQLRVVVGVGVDEAGGDDEAVGVDRLGGGLGDAAGVADGDDPSVPGSHVGPAAGGPGAVDERAALDQVVEHRPPRTR